MRSTRVPETLASTNLHKLHCLQIQYHAKNILTSVRDLKPPKAVPFHCLPVISWKGRVEISCPDGATPRVIQQEKR
jgi:hypothetical protein